MAGSIKEKIKVMEHFDNGGEIEAYDIGVASWLPVDNPCWNWGRSEYRIKESKQKIKIEKWLIEESSIQFVIETSDIDSWLKSFPTAKKLKLIVSYEVEI